MENWTTYPSSKTDCGSGYESDSYMYECADAIHHEEGDIRWGGGGGGVKTTDVRFLFLQLDFIQHGYDEAYQWSKSSYDINCHEINS